MRATMRVLLLAVCVIAAGCATTATPEAAREARDRLLDQSGVTTGSTALGAVVTDRPYVDRTAVPYRTDGARNVSVAVTGAPLGGTPLGAPHDALTGFDSQVQRRWIEYVEHLGELIPRAVVENLLATLVPRVVKAASA